MSRVTLWSFIKQLYQERKAAKNIFENEKKQLRKQIEEANYLRREIEQDEETMSSTLKKMNDQMKRNLQEQIDQLDRLDVELNDEALQKEMDKIMSGGGDITELLKKIDPFQGIQEKQKDQVEKSVEEVLNKNKKED